MRKNKQGFFSQPLKYMLSHAKANSLKRSFSAKLKGLPNDRRVTIRISQDPEFKELLNKMSKSNSAWRHKHIAKIVQGVVNVKGGRTPESQCRMGTTIIRDIAGAIGANVKTVEGRVKNVESLRKKLISDQMWIQAISMRKSNTRKVLEKFLHNEWIGIRVIVKEPADMEKLVTVLKNMRVSYHDSSTNRTSYAGLSRVKDYVKSPRQDGQLLGGNPSDVYKGIHIQTFGITGAPMEIIVWTEEMEANVNHLREKYGPAHGETYWKTPEFRAGKKNLGDYR